MKSYVTVEQACCPACGKTFDTGALLMDRRLRDKFERTTVTGFQLCPDDQAKVDEGYVILVAIDEQKSGGYLHSKKAQDVYRTGEIAYLRKHVAQEIMPSIGDHDMVWVQPEVIHQLQGMQA